MMRLLSCSLFASLILTSYCFSQDKPQVSVFTANWNEHIDAKSKQEIKSLDNQLMAAFNKGDAQKLFMLFSEPLKKVLTEAKAGELVKQVQSVITTPDYTLLDEYLITSQAMGVTQTIFKATSGDDAYKVNFPVNTSETYVSFMIYEGGIKQFLITCIYGKYDESWKLNTLRVGPYKVFGKNAVDFYKLSKEAEAKGDLIQAEMYIQVAQFTSMPGEKCYEYFKLPEMMEYNRKLAAEADAKIKLHAKIPGVDTATRVFDVEPAIINEGIFPNVKYITSIPLSDTAALRVENDRIKKAIDQVFPGIRKDKKYVFFKAYNKLPDGSKAPIPTYGFILKNEEK